MINWNVYRQIFKGSIQFVSTLIISLPSFNNYAQAQSSYYLQGYPKRGNLASGVTMEDGRNLTIHRFMCHDIRRNPNLPTPSSSCLAGGGILVSAQSQSFEPAIYIFDPNNKLIANGSNETRVRISQGGVYTVLITSENRITSADYNLEIIYLNRF